MKKKLLLLIASFYVIGCTTYKQFIVHDNMCYIDDTITDNEKNIDPTYYELLIDNIDSLNLLNDNRTNVEIWKLSNGDYTHKQTDKQTNIGRWVRYSSKGTIKNVKYHYENGLELIGNETHFDENGNITKIIDHDKGYKICWAQAIEIVKHKRKNELAKYDAVSFILGRVDLEKFPDEKPVWSVGIDPEPDNKSWETVYHKVDGITGKYLGKYKVTMVHD